MKFVFLQKHNKSCQCCSPFRLVPYLLFPSRHSTGQSRFIQFHNQIQRKTVTAFATITATVRASLNIDVVKQVGEIRYSCSTSPSQQLFHFDIISSRRESTELYSQVSSLVWIFEVRTSDLGQPVSYSQVLRGLPQSLNANNTHVKASSSHVPPHSLFISHPATDTYTLSYWQCCQINYEQTHRK